MIARLLLAAWCVAVMGTPAGAAPAAPGAPPDGTYVYALYANDAEFGVASRVAARRRRDRDRRARRGRAGDGDDPLEGQRRDAGPDRVRERLRDRQPQRVGK